MGGGQGCHRNSKRSTTDGHTEIGCATRAAVRGLGDEARVEPQGSANGSGRVWQRNDREPSRASAWSSRDGDGSRVTLAVYQVLAGGPGARAYDSMTKDRGEASHSQPPHAEPRSTSSLPRCDNHRNLTRTVPLDGSS